MEPRGTCSFVNRELKSHVSVGYGHHSASEFLGDSAAHCLGGGKPCCGGLVVVARFARAHPICGSLQGDGLDCEHKIVNTTSN